MTFFEAIWNFIIDIIVFTVYAALMAIGVYAVCCIVCPDKAWDVAVNFTKIAPWILWSLSLLGASPKKKK